MDDLAKLKIEKTDKITGLTQHRKKPLIVTAIIILFLIFGILYITGIIIPAKTVDVTTVTRIYPSQSLSVLNASGYIVAQRKAAVASKVTGRLVALLVREGNRVKKGQIIARLESEDVTAAKNQATANLHTANATLEQAKAERDNALDEYNRYKKLVSGGYVSQSEYDKIQTRYRRAVEGVRATEAAIRGAAAALKGAEAGLDYTFIRAPFDAVVLTKDADVGDIVTPLGAAATAKAAVVTIADMSSLQVEVDVSETSITTISTGQPCDIQLDALPDIRFRGKVHTIVPTVDRTKATILVKVGFLDRDPRMLPDMSAKVSFLSRNLKPEELKSRLAVSEAALATKSDRTYVLLVEGNKVKEMPVQLGERLGDMMEITDGLKAGDRVVIKPPKGLKSGARIKIAER